MPVYEYECKKCKSVMERVFKVSSRAKTVFCDKCDAIAKRIISPFAVETDSHVPWLQSSCEVLQPDYERPIETRGEYKKYLKEKGISEKG